MPRRIQCPHCETVLSVWEHGHLCSRCGADLSRLLRQKRPIRHDETKPELKKTNPSIMTFRKNEDGETGTST